MKKLLLTIAVGFSLTGFSQQIAKITLGASGSLEMISIAVDDNVIVNVTDDGTISKFGLEPYNIQTEGYGDYTDRLDPYNGRIEYYLANDNEAFRGKVKYIGKTQITYFASFDEEALKGKIKSIGASLVGYYPAIADKAFKGKLKNIGGTAFSYFSSFDNEAFRGKLRTAGPTNISYYASFDDIIYGGKVKSIGNFSYTYYSSFDRPEYRGARKSGQPLQYINGIKFYVK